MTTGPFANRSRALELEGYSVVAVANGADALTSAAEHRPDVVVLDLMMPDVDGVTVCRVLRAEGNRTPILMLTARTETSDRVAGLDAGADDYLAKPFDLDELLARLRALLRRAEPPRARPAAATLSASATCDRSRTRGGCGAATREIDLSKTEFDLLELLVAQRRGSCSSTRRSTTGSGATTSGPPRRTWRCTSGTCVARSSRTGRSKLIHTVRGVGYTVTGLVSLRIKIVCRVVLLSSFAAIAIGAFSYRVTYRAS